MPTGDRFVTISVERHGDLLKAEQQRDAVVNALGAAWLEPHEWLRVAPRRKRGGHWCDGHIAMALTCGWTDLGKEVVGPATHSLRHRTAIAHCFSPFS